jgi:hypothetical protein
MFLHSTAVAIKNQNSIKTYLTVGSFQEAENVCLSDSISYVGELDKK